MKMLSVLLQKVRDLSVVMRMSFASTFLPCDMPNYWQADAEFSVMHKPSRNELTAEQVKILVENLEVMDAETFTIEPGLFHQMVTMSYPGTGTRMGIVLISNKKNCEVCGSALKIRADRSSLVTLYDDRMGTLPATHFTKYCRKTGCSFSSITHWVNLLKSHMTTTGSHCHILCLHGRLHSLLTCCSA